MSTRYQWNAHARYGLLEKPLCYFMVNGMDTIKVKLYAPHGKGIKVCG